MEKKIRRNTIYLVQMALLIAIILLMAFTPIGYIKTLGLEITLLTIPVAVGAIVLGPAAGAVLGFVFGVTSFIQCFGASAFGAALLSINPVYTFIVCVVTRTLIGWLTGLLYAGMRKYRPVKKISRAIASLCCPVLNTMFFMGTLVLFFYQTDFIQNLALKLGAGNPLIFVALFVGINGVVETVVCFVAGTAVSEALGRVVAHTSREEK